MEIDSYKSVVKIVFKFLLFVIFTPITGWKIGTHHAIDQPVALMIIGLIVGVILFIRTSITLERIHKD